MEIFLIWLLVLLLALIFEANTSELVSVWFAFGSLFAFLIGLLGFTFVVQFSVFVTSSTGFILIMRPKVKRYLNKNQMPTNFDVLVGKRVFCQATINPHERGLVKINGVIWSAVCHSNRKVFVGEEVDVLAVDGNKLIVEKRG